MVAGEKTYRKGKLYQVSPADLKVDPEQPRKYLEPTALAELTTSVRTYGILQPVLARRVPGEGLMLVSGERRYHAALQAELTTMPVIVTDGNPKEISLVENLLRENLTAVEEAEAIYRLKDEHNYVLSDLSAILGKQQSTLSEILSIMRLPASVKDDCRQNSKVARGVLVAIARHRDEKKMEAVYQRYKENGLTAGQLQGKKRPKLKPEGVDLRFLATCLKKLKAVEVDKLDEAQLGQFTESLALLQSEAHAKLKAAKAPPAAAASAAAG